MILLEKLILRETLKDSNVLIMKCDVSDLDSVKEAGQKAVERFGDVTILINNAGIVSGKKLWRILIS